jgi:hypothetical protein
MSQTDWRLVQFHYASYGAPNQQKTYLPSFLHTVLEPCGIDRRPPGRQLTPVSKLLTVSDEQAFNLVLR